MRLPVSQMKDPMMSRHGPYDRECSAGDEPCMPGLQLTAEHQSSFKTSRHETHVEAVSAVTVLSLTTHV